ncbi:MAG: hypothetical protein ABJP45_01415 [Cyclobacteriaceae bacterium]
MKSIYFTWLIILIVSTAWAQETLTSEHLEPYTFRFSLASQHQISDEARTIISDLVGENQFVGIAEVHQSQQLSFFTTGLVSLLKEKDFNHLALELGPNSADILQKLSKNPTETSAKIKELNNAYGKKGYAKIPIIFVDKVEDALFVEQASRLTYTFWGLDQEFASSYEMLLDKIYELATNPDTDLKQNYLECKNLLRKTIFKNKISGQSTYCWYQQNETLKSFFNKFQGNVKAEKIIEDVNVSWDIYCKSSTGRGSNQQRADYMKKNFETQYTSAAKKEELPKVLVKLGGVHLTHGLSPFGVDDVGKYLHEKSAENNTGFLSIRQLISYRNGKSNIGKSGWKGVTLFLELGRKDQWTLLDLRPFREKVLKGELKTNDKYKYELNSYDLLLIPPDDKVSKLNY